MIDIYLCHICGEPIWFPHGQKMHFGTGWYCWQKQQELEESAPGTVTPVFGITTTPEDLGKQWEEALNLYNAWSRDHSDGRILKFLRRRLTKAQDQVIYHFLIHLLGEAPERRRRIVDQLVASTEWESFTQRARKRRSDGSARRGKKTK